MIDTFTPASATGNPPRLPGWDQSALVLVHYAADAEQRLPETWSLAFYREEPLFGNRHWVDIYCPQRGEPTSWWPLPSKASVPH